MRRVFRITNHKRLDLLMDERQVSSRRLGRAAGHADGSYISRMRRGEARARSVTKETAEAIALALGVPTDYLFVEVNASTGKPIDAERNLSVAGSTGTLKSGKSVVMETPAA